jgi:nitric oxide reductase activation protein
MADDTKTPVVRELVDVFTDVLDEIDIPYGVYGDFADMIGAAAGYSSSVELFEYKPIGYEWTLDLRDEKFLYVPGHSNNADHLAIEYVAQRLAEYRDTQRCKKILINISDGLPLAEVYANIGDGADLTKESVERAHRRGIRVLSFGVGENTRPNLAPLYGPGLVSCGTEGLASKLSLVMRKVIGSYT